jgi:hypothetical protein
MNPSWESLARVTFELSNNIEIDWSTNDSSWFLNWFGRSADLKVVRAFFSIKGSTVMAVYETLCTVAHRLKRPAAVRVLFEMLDTVRANSSTLADGLNFLEIAARLGSRADGMLDVATHTIESYAEPQNPAAITGRRGLWLPFLIAAAERDVTMLRLLVDAGVRPDAATNFDPWCLCYKERLVLRIGRQLLSWNPDEESTIESFVQLLIEGGVLSTKIPPRCINPIRPQVNILPQSLGFDEIVMLCPAMKRQALYDAIVPWTGQQGIFVRNAGIFAAAVGGVHSLKSYLDSCRQNNNFEIRAAMQEGLVFAARLNDTTTASALLQLGTDPSVKLLQGNKEQYDKGVLSWNPMIVAAVDGNMETLMLLAEWARASLDAFLEWAPIYEIVRQKNLNYDEVGYGTELHRLDFLGRRYTYSNFKRFGPNFEMKCEDTRRRRLELLTWIRRIAASRGFTTSIDKAILKAALYKGPDYIQAEYHLMTENHYCDVLLTEGLVDANRGYHESDMDLLQLSIRNQCSLQVVEFLLSKGLQVHSRLAAETQNTMLHDALLGRSPDRCQIVNLLLQQGADCKQMGEGLTILEASLLHAPGYPRENSDYLDVFQRLLDEGAPIRQRPGCQLEHWEPLTRLLVWAGAGDDLILRIVDTGVESNRREWTYQTTHSNWIPLVPAIMAKRETLARELIRRGADIHAPAGSDHRLTALQAACDADSSLQFIEYLVVENGANVNEAPAEDLGHTALQCCKSLPVAEFLLDHGADVNALSGRHDVRPNWIRFKYRRRALDEATEAGRLDMLEYFLKAGGRSGYGGLQGAMMLAKENKRLAILSVLWDWERKLGCENLEEAVKGQQENSDAARQLSEL